MMRADRRSRTGPQEQRDARAEAVLAEARAAGYGPGTPLLQRDQVMAHMQAAGCYLDEIGRVFGVTRETVTRRVRALRRAAAEVDQASVTLPRAQAGEPVYSNSDHAYDEVVAGQLHGFPGDIYGLHAAWEFLGRVWCRPDGRWVEQVLQHQVIVAAVVGESLPAVITWVNDRYGWR